MNDAVVTQITRVYSNVHERNMSLVTCQVADILLKSLRVRELKTVVHVFNWAMVKVVPRLYYLAIELVSMATWWSVGLTIERTHILANVFIKIYVAETEIGPGPFGC